MKPTSLFAPSLHSTLVAFAALTLTMAGANAGAAAPALAPRFQDPPPESRIIKIIHGWPAEPAAQDGLIQRLNAQGFGGVVCNLAFDHYLEGEPQWQSFIRAVHAAKQAGMALWLYDERGYPSGNAGGLVLRDHPEWEARGLLIANRECGAGEVELEVPPGRLVLASAYAVRDGRINLNDPIRLDASVRDGKLRWPAPEGRWHVMAITESTLYEGTHADGNLWQKMPYVNLLLPEPTAKFLDVTHQRYAERLGTDLGQYFVATFTDEPSLMSCFLKPMPYRPLPWASNLPVEFAKRRGYPLDTGLIPGLVADAGPRGSRLRFDFWLTVGELVSENFFGQIQERCRRLKIPSGGHLLMEEGLVAHVPFYGDFFRCARRLDAPSIDCLTSLPPDVPWYIARLLASAAELEQRRIVMCETSDHAQVWRPPGDQRPKRIVTEAEIRGTCNRLIVSGVNAITSYYSFSELSDDALRRLNEWVGRCCLMVTGGRQVADIAVVYPVESLWPKFHPARHWANESPAASRIEHTFRAAAEALFTARREFTFVDSRALREARVSRGGLAHGDLRWRVVVLPGVDTLPLAAWQQLAKFTQKGGVVIALGALPTNSESEFPSAAVDAIARQIFGPSTTDPRVQANRAGGAGVFLPAGSEGLLPLVLDGILMPDVRIDDRHSPVRSTHRRIDGREVFFLINDSAKPWRGPAALSVAGLGEQWDPKLGRCIASGLGDQVELDLDGYGAVAFTYPKAASRAMRSQRSGPLPNLSLRRLPTTSASIAAGEFVRHELTSTTAKAFGEDQPGWRAQARLTKGQVDTFLFARLPYVPSVDLLGTDCLAIDTRVPDGQSTPSQILVIVQEEGGGDFIAETGRSLAAPGWQRVYLPISRLQLAGWSKDEDGILDLRRVKEVRVGWGGYLGKEGESIEFEMTLPQAGSVAVQGASAQRK